MEVKIAKGVAFSREDEFAMYRLRYQVFSERLKWDVSTIHHMEVDDFDCCGPVYVGAKQDE